MSNETAIKQYEKMGALQIVPETVKTLLCPDANDHEISLFIEMCKHYGINPFIKEAYLIKYSPTRPASMVVSKDFFMKKADTQESLKKIEAGIIIISKGNDKELIYRSGALVLAEEKIVGGWAEIKREGRDTYRNEVSMSEYDSKKSSWLKMPATMIRKVALVQTLREAYPNVFGGLYDEAEMDQSIPVTEKKLTNKMEEKKQEVLKAISDIPAESVNEETIDTTKEVKDVNEFLPHWKTYTDIPQVELHSALDLISYIDNQLGHHECLFHLVIPTLIQNIQSVMNQEEPYYFIIKDQKFNDWKFSHWPSKNNSNKTPWIDNLTINIPNLPNISFKLDNSTQIFSVAKNTIQVYGNYEIEAFLNSTGFGTLWFIAPKRIYDLLKAKKE